MTHSTLESGIRPGAEVESDGDFGADLSSAVALLRLLPRHRDQVDQARQAVAGWAATHPGRDPELVVDSPPGDLRVTYDLVLTHPDGGSIAVTGHAEDGVPWSIEYSSHFAANRLLSVNEQSLSIPIALFALRTLGQRDPTLHEQLINHCLLVGEVIDEPTKVTPEEMTDAAIEFRRARGLHSRAATLAWLETVGLSEDTFGEHIEVVARIARFRRAHTAAHAADHLRTHQADFDRVDAVWVRAPEQSTLDALGTVTDPADLFTGAARLTGDAQLSIGRRFALDLPEPIRALGVGEVTGPVPHEGQFIVGGVRGRQPATTDPETLTRAGKVTLTRWLDERRAQAKIRWHWL